MERGKTQSGGFRMGTLPKKGLRKVRAGIKCDDTTRHSMPSVTEIHSERCVVTSTLYAYTLVVLSI